MTKFGAGYPGKTWKDAACEVAYKRIEEKSAIAVNVTIFLQGGGGCVWGAPTSYTSHKKIYPNDIVFDHDFPAFRAAFMEWLDKNEVKAK